MDKVRSIKILRNCIEKIRNASDAEKEEMMRIYKKYDKSDCEEMNIDDSMKRRGYIMNIESRINNCREHIGGLLEYANAKKERLSPNRNLFKDFEIIIKMLHSVNKTLLDLSKKVMDEHDELDLNSLNDVEFKIQAIKLNIQIIEDINMLYII